MKTGRILGAGAAVALVGASWWTERQWANHPDPSAGGALQPIEGIERTVVTDDGATIALVDSGDPSGPPIVLVHGWTEDRRVWGPVVQRLRGAGLRVVTYDQRGHGRSQVGSDGYSMGAIAGDLKAVLEYLDLQGVTVAGHSMGGMAAQAFCVEHPEVARQRLAGLVLLSTACANLGQGSERTQRFLGQMLAGSALGRAMAAPRLGPRLMRGTVGKKPVLSHLRAGAVMFAETPAASRREFFHTMMKMDLAPGLTSIAVPVTVLVGSHDRLTPEQGARKIASLIPGADLEVVPDAGHQLPYEAPDLVANHIRRTAHRKGESVVV